jgi:hypothetical protein
MTTQHPTTTELVAALVAALAAECAAPPPRRTTAWHLGNTRSAAYRIARDRYDLACAVERPQFPEAPR